MKKLAWYHALIIFFLFFVGGQIIGFGLFGVYNFFFPEVNILSMDFIFSREGLILNVIGTFSALILIPNAYLLLLKQKLKTFYNFKPLDKKMFLMTLFSVLSIGVLVQFFVETLVNIYPSFEYGLLIKENFHERIFNAIQTDNIFVFLMFITLIGILPGIGEEILFRGVLQRIYLNKFNLFVSILLSGGLFGLIHIHQQISQAIAAFLIAFYLGYIYYKSDNLWVPIIAHAINNSFFVMLTFIFPELKETLTSETPLWAVLIAFPMAIYTLLYFKRYNKV